jgi:archaemetzincin
VPREIQILNGSASLRPQDLNPIAHRLQEIFKVSVSIVRASFNMRAAHDSSRGQTNSTLLLAQILERTDCRETKQAGIVDTDLFIPILTFVFGEAQLGGTAAVVSTHRLSNQYYGLARNDALLLERLEKELVHEIGHTFGLYHCHQFECVMRASTYVEEIDLKQAHPCPACAAILSAEC